MKLFKDTNVKKIFMRLMGGLMVALLVSIAVVGFTVIWVLTT